jgi:hypothetical protein
MGIAPFDGLVGTADLIVLVVNTYGSTARQQLGYGLCLGFCLCQQLRTCLPAGTHSWRHGRDAVFADTAIFIYAARRVRVHAGLKLAPTRVPALELSCSFGK